MSSFLLNNKRNVIPRWRSAKKTFLTGELGVNNNSFLSEKEFNLEEKLQNWIKNKTILSASDLLNSAYMVDNLKIAKDAAKYILEVKYNLPRPLKQLAERIVGVNEPLRLIDNDRIINEKSNYVNNIKKALIIDPRNVLKWIDLAREYTILGHKSKAEEAINRSLFLARTNRFVLRSASRFFFHHKEYDKAIYILENSPTLLKDPWLLAPHIVLSQNMERTSKFIKTGKQIIDSGNFSPFELSELNMSLATLEAKMGNTTKFKRYLRTSIIDPTDNSLAQAMWLSEEFLYEKEGFNIKNNKKPIFSHEALARENFNGKNWEMALVNARQWFSDQTFSRLAVYFYSFLQGSAFNHYDQAIEVLKLGLRASPNDTTILNNITYYYLQKNDLQNAKNFFLKINKSDLSDSKRIVWHATQGLIYFKENQVEKGRNFYRKALELAVKFSNKIMYELALLNFALAEIDAHTDEALYIKNESLERVKHTFIPEVGLYYNKLESKLVKY